MIKIIYGAKGSGKTNLIIEDANSYVRECDGEVVFLTDTDKYMHKINYNVRLINVTDYDIVTELGLSGFVRGIIAGNNDVKRIYVDGVHRMTRTPLENLESTFAAFEYYAKKHEVELVFTASADTLPDFFNKYTLVKA